MAVDTIPQQKHAIIIGSDGCYFSCVVKAAEILRYQNIDLIRTFEAMKKKKTDGKYWVESDCFMNRPDLILGNLIKKDVSVRIVEDLSYKPKDNEIMIGMWEWFDKENNKTRQHFGNLDDYKNCIYDPLGNSNTIKYGKLKSLRVFTIK